MSSNATGDTYEDTVGTTTVRWPRVYNPVIGLGCPSKLGGCGAAPGELCTRPAGVYERTGCRGRRVVGGRVEKACPCRVRIMQADAGLWPDIPADKPPAPRLAESSAEPVELDQPA